jgi:hypothetical protein
MNRQKRIVSFGLRSVALIALGALLGFWVSSAPGRPEEARAGVRESAQPKAFLSGSERMEPILREIAATLKQLDGRVQRIEEAVTKKQAEKP